MKKLYKFDPNTGKYIGEVEAELDEWQTEIAGRPCYKGIANAVWDEPPAAEGKTAYITFNGWELCDNPALNELKAQKLTELKNIRDNEEVKPIAHNGNLFDFDNKARDRINAAIIALSLQGEGASIDWTTADNKDVKVTANDLRMVIASVAQRSNALHVAYRVAKEKIEKASTKEEVEAITLEVGE